MTYREKLIMEHPGIADPRHLYQLIGCPWEYGYEPQPHGRCHLYRGCVACWDRKIPEEGLPDTNVGKKEKST